MNGEWLLSLITTMLSLLAPSLSPLHVEVYGSYSVSSRRSVLRRKQHAMRPSVEAVQKVLLLMLPMFPFLWSIFVILFRCGDSAFTWLRRRRLGRVLFPISSGCMIMGVDGWILKADGGEWSVLLVQRWSVRGGVDRFVEYWCTI